jgi:hypothetical protein
VTTLVLAAVGVVALVRRRRGQPVADSGPMEGPAEGDDKPSWLRPGADVDRAPGAFLLAQTLGPLAVLAVPSTPIFGGIKHFMTAMPYLAVVAGIGVSRLVPVLAAVLPAARARLARIAPVAFAALVCLPALAETRRSHPDGLSHYNLLAGGFAGGASLGMNRQFWGYSVLPMLDVINREQPANRAMYWHDVIHDAVNLYKRDGRLALDVGDTGFGEDALRRSQLGILFYEKHWAIYEGWFWESYGTTKPFFVRDREGVPLVTMYRRGSP